MLEKLNFLKHKWVLRQYEYSMDDESFKNMGYIFDGEVKEHFGDGEFHTENEVLNSWYEYLQIHYQLDSQWRLKIDKRAHGLKIKELKELKLLEIHSLIKYYKDVLKSPSELRNIADSLIEMRKSISEQSEIHIYNKAIIYTLNNLYSLELLLDNDSDDELSQLKEEIEVLQARYNIDNFFADKKYIGYHLNKIQTAYDERSILDNLEQESPQLKKLEDIVGRCKRRMQWAYAHHSLIFQLPYDQSLVPVSDNEFKGIYYASTFALPIPQYTNQKEFRKLELQYEKLAVIANLINNLKPEFQEITKLNAELKDNDFRSMEIVGVFTAIVTFVFTLIPSFQFIKSIKHAILFSAVLAASLSSMLLVLLIIKKGSKSFSEQWVSFLSFALIILISILFFINL